MTIKRHLVHDEKLNKGKIKLISVTSFLVGFASSSFVYIMSYYLKLATGMENLGVFYLIPFSIIFLILLNFHKIIRKLGRATTFYIIIFFKIIVIAFLSVLGPTIAGVIFLMLYLIFGALLWVSLDLILETFSTDSMSGRIRGTFLTIANAGFIFGPFLSTRILDSFGFNGVFTFLLMIYSIIFIISLVGFRNVNHRFNRSETSLELIKKVFKRKNVMRSYYVSCTLYFFYALMVIYTPLYLINLGMTTKEVGLAFTIMLIPFILIQYPAGFLADKKIGEKEGLIAALLIIGFATIGVYFTNSASVAVWALVLFITRIGAALLEVMGESYFYKRIGKKDVDLIDFYRTARPTAYILASASSAVLLIFFPIKSVFILVAIVAFAALIPAFQMVDNKSESERF